MPPRKRARRSTTAASGDGHSPTPAPPTPSSLRPRQPGQEYQDEPELAPLPTQAKRRKKDWGQRSRGSTRLGLLVRGPELATAEGGSGDLVPPSDDDEYEEWKAVRAVERYERRTKVSKVRHDLDMGLENAVAGPSTLPAGLSVCDDQSTPPPPRQFVPLFTPFSSPELVSSPPLPPSPQLTPLPPRYSPSPPPRRSSSPSSLPPLAHPDHLRTLSGTTEPSTSPLPTLPSESPANRQGHVTATTTPGKITLALSSPKPFAMLSQMPLDQRRDRLPSMSQSRSPSAPPSPGAMPLVPPHPPPASDLDKEDVAMERDRTEGDGIEGGATEKATAEKAAAEMATVEMATAEVVTEEARASMESPVESRRHPQSRPRTMDRPSPSAPKEALLPSTSSSPLPAPVAAAPNLPPAPLAPSQPSTPAAAAMDPLASPRSTMDVDQDEESQLPKPIDIREAGEEIQFPIVDVVDDEPWGMDLEVLEAEMDVPRDHGAPVPDDDQMLAEAPVSRPPSTPPALTTSPPRLPSSGRTVVPDPQPSPRVDEPALFSQPMLPPTPSIDVPRPSSPAAAPSPASHPAPQRPASQRPASQRAPPLTPDAVDLLSENGGVLFPPAAVPPAVEPSPAPEVLADPALLQFRFMRTFRTRTALQLQPYTKEKQIYENALRRGGLHKGRRAVAPSAEIREANEEDQTQTQEGDESTSDSDATPPDAIVIGGTQDQQIAHQRRREPKPLVDADYDEYFLEFGETPDEEDEVAQGRLQIIARTRLRAEKEQRRKERAAERMRRGFEALMREDERDKEADRRAEREKERAAKEKEKAARRKVAEQRKKTVGHGKTPTAASKDKNKDKSKPQSTRERSATTTDRTPAGGRGRPITYGRRQQRPVVHSGDSSPLSSAPPSPSELQHADLPPSNLPPTMSTPALTSPLGQRRRLSLSPHRGLLDTSDFGGALDDFGDGFDDFGVGGDGGGEGTDFGGYIESDDDRPVLLTTPGPPSSPPLASSSRIRRRRIAESSSQSSNDDTPRAPVNDKRRRIAERMMPRAMLKRLEQEAAAQRRRKEDSRRRNGRVDVSVSPVRPGHAVVRRGAGGNFDDLDDLFGNDDSGAEAAGGMIGLEADEGGDSDASPDEDLGRQLVLTLDSDSDSGGSEALEDNGHPAALARLQRGDFEAIVHGRRSVEPRPRGELRRQRRPALPIARPGVPKRRRRQEEYKGLESRVLGESQLYQTRLDFPVEKTPEGQSTSKKSSKKSKSGPRQGARGGKGARPAIRLDDNVIFATGDFAFSSDDDIEIIGSTPAPAPPARAAPRGPLAQMAARGGRLYARSASSSSPVPAPLSRRAPTQLDVGVGKARSWANFDRFPVDFDIKPLPAGVFCSLDSIPASGRLRAVLAQLDGAAVDDAKPLSAYGVSLHSQMGVDEALGVLPIIVDGMMSSIRTFLDATTTSGKPDLRPLRFLRDYLARADKDTRHRVLCALNFAERLDDIVLTGSRAQRPLILQLLEVRYTLLELAAVAGAREAVMSAATRLISLLLVYGFDRTVRPLRRILSGAADTPEVSDLSVSLWIATLHLLAHYDRLYPPSTASADDAFSLCLFEALDKRYKGDVGPLAAERIWFLVFGLAALAQFGADGAVVAAYEPSPRWSLVKRALGHIKITHSQEAEEAAHPDQLTGRDRYIKTMVARCLRLSSIWRWYFDATSFSVATRDLGQIFKARASRPLPTEPAADFPGFITSFDVSLTAAAETKGPAFELWLRLACVAASDLISGATELSEAHKAERDVQRLIMSIFPLSSVPFTRASPPTPRQLGALVNRYATMVVAAYFSPSLLSWLLANSNKWLEFKSADVDSRHVSIRGLMYLAVACRHHDAPLGPVVARLADILAILQRELEQVGKGATPANFPTKVEIERTMVLVVSCFRQIILHPGYRAREEAVYPDPSLLHECWTSRIFQLDLVKDVKSGLEIVATIQAFLDARAAALPGRARAARTQRQQESLDDYPSLGFDFDAVDLAALGGDEAPEDPIERSDADFAQVILNVICPRIYRLLSDMLPASEPEPSPSTSNKKESADRLVLISKLTQCWSDCAAIVVVEHGLQDWNTYIGPYGQQSWSRIGNEIGRIRVGLQFMTNVARLDPSAFKSLEEEFLALLFQSIVTDSLSMEHKFASALFGLPGALDHALFEGVRPILRQEDGAAGEGWELGRTAFAEKRQKILEAIFKNIPTLLGSRLTPGTLKTLIYRCVNTMVASIAMYEAAIPAQAVLRKQNYRVFGRDVVRALKNFAGMDENNVPTLKTVAWVGER